MFTSTISEKQMSIEDDKKKISNKFMSIVIEGRERYNLFVEFIVLPFWLRTFLPYFTV